MKEFIKKHNKNIKDNNLKAVNHGDKEEVSIIFDECTEHLSQKEQNNSLYLPFLALSNEYAQGDITNTFFDISIIKTIIFRFMN